MKARTMWMFGAGVGTLLVAMGACGGEPSGEPLTTVVGPGATSAATGSGGSTTTGGSGGQGGEMASSSVDSASSAGGAGGAASVGSGTGGSGGMSSDPVCGNGKIEAMEECDDGNGFPQDGCDNFCKKETGWSCKGEPSVCLEVQNNCDPHAAVDMTGMGDVDLSLPTKSSMQSFMSCIKVSAGTKVHFKMSDPTSHYPVGGTTDGMSVKVDGSTFIKCCSNDSLPVYQGCCGSPFNCCTSEEIFTFSQAGIYPWYDAKNFALIHGMIIVQ